MLNFGFVSYSVACVAFLVFSWLLATSWRGRLQGALLTTACVITMLWALAAALANYIGIKPHDSAVLQILEWMRHVAWLLFLLRLLNEGDSRQFKRPFLRISALAILGLSGLLLALVPLNAVLDDQQILNFRLITHLLLAFIGLVLVEQLYRNLKPERRWAFKFLAFGLGGMFVYEFYFYSDALLFRRIDPNLWDARGIINAVIVPMIAVSAARNPSWSLDIFVSRGMVFHGAAILGASLYLLAMAAGGYYIRIYGGSWGSAMQMVFLFAAVMLLVSLLSSGQLRAKVQVFINKHFYNYKYDYREEWKRFIETLDVNDTGERLREKAIGAVAQIVQSPSALMLKVNNEQQFEPAIYWNMPRHIQPVIGESEPLIEFIKDSRWIVDLNEYERYPERYDHAGLPHVLAEAPWAWLVVPVFIDRLRALLILSPSHAERQINWEDRDLLRLATFQAANYIQLLDAGDELSRARQFETFNQLSAFVMHDLKNLLAQLSLVVTNAKKHKNNPDFIDDAVGTLENSVQRMAKLLSQLKNASPRMTAPHRFDLVKLCKQVVDEKATVSPPPRWESEVESVPVMADEQRMFSVLGHLIQNAQEATRQNGQVVVRLTAGDGHARLEIQDNGIGMDETFVKSRLFRPFDTTKGLTGMGIGAYEAKLYVEQLGGSLQVHSRPGQGTTFRIKIPVAS